MGHGDNWRQSHHAMRIWVMWRTSADPEGTVVTLTASASESEGDVGGYTCIGAAQMCTKSRMYLLIFLPLTTTSIGAHCQGASVM